MIYFFKSQIVVFFFIGITFKCNCATGNIIESSLNEFFSINYLKGWTGVRCDTRVSNTIDTNISKFLCEKVSFGIFPIIFRLNT